MVAEYSASVQQIAVRKGSGIKSIQDLKGKRVVVGAVGGGTEATWRFIMRSVGLHDGNNYLFNAEYSGVQEGCDMIANNQADATCIGGTIPFSAFTELFLSDKIELIGYTEAEVKAVVDAKPSFSRVIIPAGSYAGKVPADLLAVQNRSGICVVSTVSDEEVYNIVKIMHEHWDELGTIHDLFTQQKAEDMVPVTTQAPTHPGALKYYREQGWIK
jgi:TRAP transporter TAXI family solute receptor